MCPSRGDRLGSSEPVSPRSLQRPTKVTNPWKTISCSCDRGVFSRVAEVTGGHHEHADPTTGPVFVVPFELAPKGIDGRPVFNSRADVSWAGFVPVADEHRGTYDREDDGGVDPLAGGERGCGRKYQQQEQRLRT